MVYYIVNNKGDNMNERIINNIKSLGIDMIKEANSGHSGIVLGAAPILYTLYSKHLNFNVNDPKWINRDRFVLSAGHGSALLYATLFMADYLTINDLKQFRKINSRTPGHPEMNVTPGVDMTTGPLGQGFASAVGMALAEAKLEEESNGLIHHKIYVLCSDGDLMEGITNEAASLAGALGLNNLIVLYDSNHICLSSDTNKTFRENIPLKFESMGWDSILVKDGNNIKEIDRAIEKAKKNKKPTIIEIKTTLGKDSLLENTNKVHGAILTEEDIHQLKQKWNIPFNPFYVDDEARGTFQKQISSRVYSEYDKWTKNYQIYSQLSSEQKRKFQFYFEPEKIEIDQLEFNITLDEKEATRVSNLKILNYLSSYIPSMIVGSADLAYPTGTYLENKGDIEINHYTGQNIYFGVREHAMGAILNGLAIEHFRPFASTFLAFSDYLKPSIRMSALLKLPVTYIFSHDSINIGEDGPTHQPIEQIASLRSIPNFKVYRPCDANELIGCYRSILKRKEPCALLLSRVEYPIFSHSKRNIEKGAYIIQEEDHFKGIIIATGTDVHTAIYIANALKRDHQIPLRVVSMPNRELFEELGEAEQEEILPKGYKKFVIEAGSSYGWEGYVYNKKYLCTLDQFGKSGNKDDVLKACSFDFNSLLEKILNIMK